MDNRQIIGKIEDISNRIKTLEDCNSKIISRGIELKSQYDNSQLSSDQSAILTKLTQLKMELDSNESLINRLNQELFILQRALDSVKGDLSKEELDKITSVLLN